VAFLKSLWTDWAREWGLRHAPETGWLTRTEYVIGERNGLLFRAGWGSQETPGLIVAVRFPCVADLEGMDLRIFDRKEKRFLADKTLALGARAFMPAFVDDRTLLVPLQSPDGLARIDIDAATIVKRVPFGAECKSPHVVQKAGDGRVYLVCEGDHVAPGAVVQIDPATLAVVKRWEVGVYPDGIAFGEERSITRP